MRRSKKEETFPGSLWISKTDDSENFRLLTELNTNIAHEWPINEILT